MTTLENKINRASNDASTAKQILQALFDLLKRRKYFVIVFVAIIVVGFGIYGKYFNLTDAERAQKELSAAVAAVGELMILPEGDEPVLATVTDAEALIKQQAFFAGAVDGDQLLLFPKNMKAVIYSPSRNKIINAGPIEQQPTQQQVGNNQIPSTKSQTDSTQPSPEAMAGTAGSPQVNSSALTVEIRNGTGKSGLATQVADNLRAAGFKVITVADAKNKNYSKTILLTRNREGVKGELTASLAAQIGAEFITDLPNGEKNTYADALIILGE